MQIILLVAVLLVVLANLVIVLVLWWRHEALSVRVAKLEAHRESALTHAEVRSLYDRLATIEGQNQTMTRLLQTVQEHLLEND